MLGKLVKHEFKETYKLFGIVYAAFLLLTLVSRFSVNIPFDNILTEFLSIFLNVVYVISIFGLSFAVMIIAMIRFNNKMFKDEAYLTHTIPVKTWQHIASKVFTYSVWVIISAVMMVVSIVLYFIGTDEFDKIMKVIDEIIGVIGDYPVTIVTIVLVAVVCIFQVVANILAFTSALSLGQIFRKHKIAGAVFFYFVLNSVMSTATSYLMYLFPNYLEKMETFEREIEKANTTSEIMNMLCSTMNIMFAYSLVIVILMIVVYFFITNYMLSKKLELE